MSRPAVVYRLLNRSGDVLYVGMTTELAARLRAHRRDKPWWPEVRDLVVESFLRQREALDRERWLIRRLAPEHNACEVGQPYPIGRDERRSRPVAMIDPNDLVGPDEIRRHLGLRHQRPLQELDDMPSPVAVVSDTPVWEWPEVERWARTNGRWLGQSMASLPGGAVADFEHDGTRVRSPEAA